MNYAFKGLALLVALGGGAWLIYRAQTGAQVQQAPDSAASLAPAQAAPTQNAPASDTQAAQKATDKEAPEMMGSSKLIVLPKNVIRKPTRPMMGGSKSFGGGELPNLFGNTVGEAQGFGAVDVRGINPPEHGKAKKPPVWMGGSKYQKINVMPDDSQPAGNAASKKKSTPPAVWMGGSKAAMSGEAGLVIGIGGMAPASKGPASKAPDSKAPASKAPESAAPTSKAPESAAPNAPFMGSSKFAPGALPLPPRPKKSK